jgi:predicted metal-binding protein
MTMPKHTLFVCKACNTRSEEENPASLSDGSRLLNDLQSLCQTWSHRDELEIQAVGCLWTCSRPCAVAFSATNKSTYLFTNLPSSEANSLLQFGELYLKSEDGDIPWKQFPEVLQSAEVAKIPPILLQ